MAAVSATSGRSSAVADRRYVRNPEFVFRRIGGEVLLLPVRQRMGDLESIYSLNEVGARAWELLAAPRSAAELADAVVREFDVEPRRATADLESFLAALAEIGGVEPA
jgi:hypothetical protein